MIQQADRVRTILGRLLEKSRQDLVRWEVGDEHTRGDRVLGREFNVGLDDARITVVRCSPSDSAEYVLVSLCDEKGLVVDQWSSESGDENWAFAEEFVGEARRIATSSTAVLENIERALQSEGPIGRESGAREFLRGVAGDWVLHYERRGRMLPEELSIDESGRYCLRTEDERIPVMELRNVNFDPTTRKVIFDKVDTVVRGRRREHQTEVLTVSEDFRRMHGVAAHDGHRLEYARIDDE